MLNLAEFIEKYGTHAAQELLDFIFIKDMYIRNAEARDMLIRWKVITRQTKNVYKWSAYHRWRDTYVMEFKNQSRRVLFLEFTSSEIESLRATIYKRGEESIA